MSQPLEGTSVPNVYQPSAPLGEIPSAVVLAPGQPKTPAEQVELLTKVFNGLSEEEIDAIVEIATNRQPFFGE
jgi:hypothetical protein